MSLEDQTVRLAGARESLKVIEKQMNEVDGRRAVGQDQAAARAAITRQLLFLSHLIERLRVEVMDEYYIVKGFDAHLQD